MVNIIAVQTDFNGNGTAFVVVDSGLSSQTSRRLRESIKHLITVLDGRFSTCF